MKIAIIGAGFGGMAAAYEIAKAGHEAVLIERDNNSGGLAATFSVGGQDLEKFYHHWLGTDEDIFNFARELGYGHRLKLKESKVGIYFANKNYRFSSPLDLLNFTPLPFLSRLRFGFSILYSWFIRKPKYLEKITAEKWLLRVSGKNAYQTIWKPLLIGKFGEEYYKKVAAIWIWNKLIQRGQSRDSKAREFLGYYEGGFSNFINDLSSEIIKLGGAFRHSCEVEEISGQNDGSVSLRINGSWENFDRAIYTGHTPELAELFRSSGLDNSAKELDSIDYLGNICLILETTKSLSETYWLNVNDPTFPFVGIIEHTNFEDANKYSGKHLIYLSKYVPITHEMFSMTEGEMTNFAIPHIKRLFPHFDENSITRSFVWRAKYAQPIIGLNYSEILPNSKTEIDNFFVCTMAQVFPEDRGTNYAVKHGRQIGKSVAQMKD